MNGNINQILAIEQRLAALDKAKDLFQTHPVNRDFFKAHYRVLKRKRADLTDKLSSEDRVMLRNATREARGKSDALIIGGPIAGVTPNGKPFAFIPTGPLLELRAVENGKIVVRKARK